MKGENEIMNNVNNIIQIYERETQESRYIFNESERIIYAISILEEIAVHKKDEEEERALFGHELMSVHDWKQINFPDLSHSASTRLGRKASDICYQYGEFPQKVDRLYIGTGKSKLICPITLYPEYTLDLAAKALRLPIKKLKAA